MQSICFDAPNYSACQAASVNSFRQYVPRDPEANPYVVGSPAWRAAHPGVADPRGGVVAFGASTPTVPTTSPAQVTTPAPVGNPAPSPQASPTPGNSSTGLILVVAGAVGLAWLLS
jgi:hypothetical protein